MKILQQSMALSALVVLLTGCAAPRERRFTERDKPSAGRQRRGGPSKWVLKNTLGDNRFRHPRWVNSVSFSRDGTRLVTAGGRSVCVWSTDSGAKLKEFGGNRISVSVARLSPDGKTIAVAGGWDDVDVTVRSIDAESGRELCRFVGHGGQVYNVFWSPDGDRIISLGGKIERCINIWSAKTGRCIRTIAKKGLIGRSMAVSSDGKIAVTSHVGKPMGITVWDLQTGKARKSIDLVGTFPYALAVSADGTRAALPVMGVGQYECYGFVICSTTNGEILARREEHGKWLRGFAFSRGNMFASAGYDGLILWDNAEGGIRRKFKTKNDGVSCVEFSPDGRLVAYGCHSGAVSVYPVGDVRAPTVNAGGATVIGAMDVSTDGRKVFAGTRSGAIRCIKLSSGKEIARLEAHRTPIRFLESSADGRHLFSVSDEEDVSAMCYWDLGSGRVLQTFNGDDRRLTCARLSPDGKRMISSHGGTDTDMRLWDTHSGRMLQRVEVPRVGLGKCYLNALAFGAVPDLVYASYAGSILRPCILSEERWLSDWLQKHTCHGLAVARDSTVVLHVRSHGRREGRSRLVLYRLPAPSGRTERELSKWAQQLGSPEHKVRGDASESLEAAGWDAVHHARRLADADDPEVATRARAILRALELAAVPREIGELKLDYALGWAMDIDSGSGLWAATRATEPARIPNGVIVGSFDVETGEMKVLRVFGTNDNPQCVRLLPGGKGLVVGNYDSTISHYALP